MLLSAHGATSAPLSVNLYGNGNFVQKQPGLINIWNY